MVIWNAQNALIKFFTWGIVFCSVTLAGSLVAGLLPAIPLWLSIAVAVLDLGVITRSSFQLRQALVLRSERLHQREVKEI
ncbi:MAG: hypothetical protein WBA31_03800 [Candidatus Dormiibacterota bacterium]